MANTSSEVFFHSKAYTCLCQDITISKYDDYTFETDFYLGGNWNIIETKVRDSSNKTMYVVTHNFMAVDSNDISLLFQSCIEGQTFFADYLRKNSNWELSSVTPPAYGYSPSDEDILYARKAIALVETYYDIPLIPHGYDFDDVVQDFKQFSASVDSIRISSTVIMSIFIAFSICEIVAHVTYVIKKRKVPQEEISDNKE